MIQKRILVPARLRRPPATGWSWLDRRFVREQMAHLSREAVLSYLFLSAVADRHGLSFYSDGTLATLLRMTLPALIQAREELLAHDLIAHEVRWTRCSLCRHRVVPPVGAWSRTHATGRTSCRHTPAHSRPREGTRHECRFWAEIRRLAEIEKLSGWAISRRLHCSRRTVAAARRLDQPPAAKVVRRASLLDSHRAKIDALVAKYPELSAVRICEEISSRPRWLYRQCQYSPPLPADGPARARACLPGSPIRAGRDVMVMQGSNDGAVRKGKLACAVGVDRNIVAQDGT